MRLREELTDYLEANIGSSYKNIREAYAVLEAEDTHDFDAKEYPLLEVIESSTEILQCLDGKTNFHVSDMILAVSVLVNNSQGRSRNPNVRARAKTRKRTVDALAKEIEDTVDNLTFNINGVYLQSSQLININEGEIDGDNSTILQKVLTFKCSYNA